MFAFSSGYLVSDPIKSIYTLIRGNKALNCVAKDICVGYNKDSMSGFRTLDTIGGLSFIFCGEPYDIGNIDYIFIDGILKGETCERNQYTLTFSTDKVKTKITVINNIISSISQGPLHALDP